MDAVAWIGIGVVGVFALGGILDHSDGLPHPRWLPAPLALIGFAFAALCLLIGLVVLL